MKPISTQRDAVVAGGAERTPSVRWALASLSLSMLLPSLGTSIANAGLPMLAHAFNASFQQVQWIVLAYLLAITTLIVSVGQLGDIIKSFPLGAETQELQPWEERPALAALAYWVALNRSLWYNCSRVKAQFGDCTRGPGSQHVSN